MKGLVKANLERPDLLDANSPKGLRVVQLTADPDVPCTHVYMEAQIFSPDSKRFLLKRSGHAHGPVANDPEHRYLLCDIESGCRVVPITDELNAIGPSWTPDGCSIYYFVDNGVPDGGRVELKRVRPDGTGRETLTVIDSPLPGSEHRMSLLYPLSTISSDGRRLAISCFLGDGRRENMPWGLAVFDLEKGTGEVVFDGPSFCNMHAQYSRSSDPIASHDVLIQENHGCQTDPTGNVVRSTTPPGADIHVIRDDGTNFRTLPWGRDGVEYCQGHQCWRGPSEVAITSTQTYLGQDRIERQLIEGRPCPDAGHKGRLTPRGWRNDLTREFMNPQFWHFAVDRTGGCFIADAIPRDERSRLYLAVLPKQRSEVAEFRYLLNPRSSNLKTTHPHPFLSPDGSRGFFNSDESGTLQAYMIEGLTW